MYRERRCHSQRSNIVHLVVAVAIIIHQWSVSHIVMYSFSFKYKLCRDGKRCPTAVAANKGDMASLVNEGAVTGSRPPRVGCRSRGRSGPNVLG